MSSAEAFLELTFDDRRRLLDIARQSIASRLAEGQSTPVDDATASPALRTVRACFVTLRIRETLRGCMGCLKPERPLIRGVSHHAQQAAFHDPRFPALDELELSQLSIQISVLSPPAPIHCVDEADLLRQLQPGIDGVILRHGSRSATLLPQVWQHASQPREFLSHLKRKAGLPVDDWPPGLTFQRYVAESFGEDELV